MQGEEDHVALQNDINLQYEWSLWWQLKFSTNKHKHLHFGPAHFYAYGSFYLNSTVIANMISYKDLGVIIPYKISRSHH